MKIGSTLKERILPKKQIAAIIVGYDYAKKQVIAQANGKDAYIALEDISLYQDKCIKNNNLDERYINRILGTQVLCDVIGYKNGYILSRTQLMERRAKKFNEGDHVTATVISISDSFLYLEFDEGLNGIMYINKINNNQKFSLYSIGDKIECIIERKNNSFFRLRQAENKDYKVGDMVEATLVSTSKVALYFKFANNLTGTMYLKEVTSAKTNDLSTVFKVGEKINCKIIEKKKGYYILSRLDLYKQVNPNIQKGDIIKCRITQKLRDGSGYHVEVSSNPLYSGIFDINEYNKNKHYNIGDTITLRVAEIKDNKYQLRLRTNY